MAKHLNPLEKELMISKYRNNPGVRLSEFCNINNVSDAAFRKWLKQYEEGDLKVLPVPMYR